MLKNFINKRVYIIFIFPFILGSLSVFSFQPFNFTYINFLIFPLLFLITTYVQKKSKSTYRKKPYLINIFFIGYLFGIGFFLSGTHWISNSLSFDENFKYIIPFSIISLPLILGLFFGLANLLAGPFIKNNFVSILFFSASFAFFDFLRSKILTGFPWNLWAYSLSWSTEILQILNYVGLFAFNLMVITFFTLPVILFYKIGAVKKTLVFLFSGILILGLHIYGSYEINKNNSFLQTVDNKINVKIISPNFELEYGLSMDQIKKKLKKVIRYSNPDNTKKTLFIWPEGVFSGYNYNEILVFKELIKKNFSKEHFIIFGINKLNVNTGLFYNSLILYV